MAQRKKTAANELKVVFIPLEIVEKILINLPVKSLLRFKIVSKSWRSLISEPGFIRKHLNHASQPENLSQKTLIIGNEGEYYPINFPCFPLSTLQPPHLLRCPFRGFASYYWLLLASCDGLLCLWICDSVYIWNPCLTTNAYTRVSSPTAGRTDFLKYWGLHLNLGYDSTTDDYKLLMLSSGAIETRVYSLRSESWTKHDNQPDGRDYLTPDRSVFVNGSFHWIGFPICDPEKPAIFSFHLSDGKYGEVVRPFPELVQLDLQSRFVVETCLLKGMLGVMVKLESSHDLLVWVMKDFFHGSREWTKILDITLVDDDDFLDDFFDRKDVRPFYMGENGEVKMGVFSRERCIWRPQGFENARSGIFVHVESMISPVSSVGNAAAAAIRTDLPDGDNKNNVFFQLLTQDKYVHNL